MYKALIVGAGKIGAFFDAPDNFTYKTHASAFYRSNLIEFIGFLDTNKERGKLAAERWGCRSYSSITEVESVDIVVIATSDSSHYSVFEDIVSLSPKIVILEKPISDNLETSRKLKYFADQNDVEVIVNFSRRFFPGFQEVVKMINEGDLGNFIRGHAYYGKGINHNGSHLIDLLLSIFSEVEIKSVSSGIRDYENDVSITGELLVDGHPFNLFAVDSNLYTIFEQEFVFDSGRIRINDSGQRIVIEKKCSSDLYEGYFYLKEVKKIDNNFNETFKHLLEHIIQVLNGEDNISTISNAMKVQLIGFKIREALR